MRTVLSHFRIYEGIALKEDRHQYIEQRWERNWVESVDEQAE
jgi:hypothetical protein